MDHEDVNEDIREIGALLADECAQTILIETRTKPMSAAELSERCDVSPQTIYRRIEDLTAHDLLDERLEIDDDGHHYKVYVAALDRISIRLTADGLELELSLRDRMASRFTEFVDRVRER